MNLILLTGIGRAVEIVRSGSNGPVDQASAWDGGVVPGPDDIAVWDSGANAGTTTLGSALSWGGIKILDPSAVATGGSFVLTLGSDGIDMTTASVDAILDFDYELGASTSWNVAAGRTLFINNAAISGTSSSVLTLTGSGTVYSTRAVDQTYAGGTVLENGVTYIIGANNGGGNFGTGSVTFKDNVTLAGHTTGNRELDTLAVFSGVANTVTFGSTNFETRMIVSAGMELGTAERTISLVNTGSASTSNIALTLGGTISAGAGGSLVLANGNATPGTQGVLVKLGDSVAAEAVVNGSLTIGENVEAYFRSSNNLGVGTDLTVNGTLDMSAKNTATIAPTIKSLSGTGTIFSGRTNGNTNTLTIDGGAATTTTTFSGVIQDGSTSPIALIKTGSSTQVFSGDNTYTGNTTITAGTLIVNGDQSAATGNVTVDAAGTLGGTGTVGGTTTVNGFLSPGESPGTLTFSQGLNINDGSTYAFEGGDLVAVTGQLDLNDNWTLALGTGLADGGSIVIFSYGSLAGSPDLTPTFDTSGLGFVPSGPLTLSNDTINNTIVLNGVSLVPEPSTVGLLGFGLSVVLFGYRRRNA